MGALCESRLRPAVPAGVGEEVVEVYSNSSSAPNSASSTFLRSPSETTSATAPPTMPSRSSATEAAAALLLLGRLVEADADVAHAARGLADVLLQLLVLEDLLRRALAVAQPPVGVASRLVGLDDVLPQVLVLDEPLDVRVGAGRLSRLPGLLHLLVRHRSLAQLAFKVRSLGRAYPGPPFTSAASNTSPISSTQTKSRFLRSASGMSSMSGSLRDGRQNAPHARPLRGQRLLLQAADREHLAGQRELARHRRVVAHRAPGDQ